MRRWPAIVVALGLAVVLGAAPASDIDPAARAVLVRHLRFTPHELADLQRGRTVKHGIDTNAPGEIAVAGAARIGAPKAEFLNRFRDIAAFKRGPGVIEIGRFSRPPALDDLAGLTVTADDFDPRNCRVGDCGVRLPADVIRRVPSEIDLKAADVQQRAEAFFKRELLDDVTAYVSGAPGRFMQYDDGSRPIRPIDEFDALLKNAPSIDALVPGLAAHLARYPADPLAGAEDFLYWSKETAGRSPFITVTHVTIVCPTGPTCVITSKDVYSSRYIDTSLGVTIATDTVANADAFYLVYANRSRANALKGFLSGMRRGIVERRARAGLEESLNATKTRLENGRM